MSDPFLPRIGAVLSADVAAPDHKRVQEFYFNVLRTGEKPRWGDGLVNNLGMPIVGVGERIKEYEHLPQQWMPHIQVADVGASVEHAIALRGDELMHHKNGNGVREWAVLQDPNGAAFGIVPVSASEAAPADEAEPGARSKAGRIAWLDLTVGNAAETRDFYRQVVGWSVEEAPMTDGGESYADFCMLDENGDAVAGVCHSRGMNVGLPSVWLIYLPVGDLAESVRQVEAGGGAVVKATRDSDGAYATVVVRDPVGGHFALVPA